MKRGTRTTPSKVSAVVADVDGTLVTDEKILTASATEAVAKLRAAGIKFAIVSSRPPLGLRMLIERLDITTVVGAFNGGVIATPALTTIDAHLLAPEVAQRTIEMLDAQGVDVWVFSGQDWLVRHATGAYVPREQRTVGFGPTVVDDFRPFLGEVGKIVGVSVDFEQLARCEGKVRAALTKQATVALSQPYYLDVTHPLANKGEALSAMAKLLAIPVAEIAVIGDGRNDIAMFKRAGLSIAMGNASLEVKQAADFVTGSNRDNGFAQAIETSILGGERSNEKTALRHAGGRA